MSDTTSDQPQDDIRSAVAAAWDEVAQPDDSSSGVAQDGASDTPSEAPSSRARGPDGKFVKAEEAEPTKPEVEEPAKAEKPEEPKAEEKPEAKPEEPAGALKSWSQAERDALAKAPPEVQQLVAKRYGDLHADYTRKSQEIATFRKDWDPVAGLFSPHADIMRQKGLTPSSLIKAWYDVERGLMQGGETALGIITNIAQGYKIDPAAIARALGVQPAVSQAPANPEEPKPDNAVALPPEVQARLDRLEQAEIQRQREAQAAQVAQYNDVAHRVQSDIDHFAGATDKNGALLHPHFHTVEANMTRAVMAYKAAGQPVPPLDQLYDEAVWANPETRAAIQAEQRAADQAQREQADRARAEEARKKAEQARRAGSSVTGAPANKAPSRQSESLREQLESAFDEVA